SDVEEMGRRGIALVPTMTNVETFAGIAASAEEKFPAYARHMRHLGERHPAIVAAAYEAGVPIYVGTDAGGTLPHGLAVDEMLRLHERAGMSTVDVLAAGSYA